MKNSEMTEKVSILIPTYNSENYIDKAIESALNQTYENIEIVISDNASTDGTKRIIEKYSNRNNVTVNFNSENLGPVENWRMCLKLATGKWVKFVFSDDELYQDALCEMTDSLNGVSSVKRIGLVLANANIGKASDNFRRGYRMKDGTFDRKEYLKGVVLGINPVSPGASLILKELITERWATLNHLHSEKCIRSGAGADMSLMLEALSNDTYIGVMISKPLIFFRVHDKSITIKNSGNEVSEAYASRLVYEMRHSEDIKDLLSGYLFYKYFILVLKSKKFHNFDGFLKSYDVKSTEINMFGIFWFVLIFLEKISVRSVAFFKKFLFH